MIESIVSHISMVVGQLLNLVLEKFASCLALNLDVFLAAFPFIATTYEMFQAIGIGLVACIGIFQLFKFFFGKLSNTKDTPILILLRAGMAIMLIYFGGHFLSLVVDLAKTPYDAIASVNAVAWDTTGLSPEALSKSFTLSSAVGSSAALFLHLILIGLIAWNVVKLIIEVAERFVMVGILVYSAPLVYPTLTSSMTADIFKKWLGMFFGQCLLMTLSVWTLKLIISGFSASDVTDVNGVPVEITYALKFVLTLAMCKIAQRIDSYLQQLGIGVATTGGNLLDDILATGRMFKSKSGGSGSGGGEDKQGNGKTSVLGGLGGMKNASLFGGALGAVSNAFQQGVGAIKDGASAKTVMRAVGKGALVGATRSFFSPSSVANARAEAVAKRAVEGTDAFYKRAARFAGGNAKAGDTQASNDGGPSINEKAKMAGKASQQYANTVGRRQAVGTCIKDSDTDNELALNDEATAANLKLSNNYNSQSRLEGKEPLNPITGPDEALGEHIAANYEAAGVAAEENNDREYQEILCATAQSCSPLAAENALMNPEYEFHGNDELGNELIKNAFGGKAATAFTYAGGLKNVSATTAPMSLDEAGRISGGGRVVSGEYNAVGGAKYKLGIHDDVSYANLTQVEKMGAQKVETSTGNTYYLTRQRVIGKGGPGDGSGKEEPSVVTGLKKGLSTTREVMTGKRKIQIP